MATESETPQKGETKNDWTVMFFFAGDNHLSPSMISQLKAIKDAGFQKNTTVLIYFDPNERGSRVSIFEVNRKRKTEKPDLPTVIGEGFTPFVANLTDDDINDSNGAHITDDAGQALRNFLDFGLRRRFSAKHYILFLVGHGIIVGNDAFLPDARPESAISLEQLGDILGDFSRKVKLQNGVVDLIGLHSCSMSAIEVVYQLKGAARYLMATEGESFVSSWPYRQVMKQILLTIEESAGGEVNVDELVKDIQRLSLHNSTDFMFSGFSADLSLCSLDATKVDELDGALMELTKALKNGLKDSRGKELILLSHLKAQSYWQETYTDLYDFCLCLEKECKQDGGVQAAMQAACHAVRQKLDESNKLVVQSDQFGPAYQYSHGLSVYFPWSGPVEDDFDDILGRYRGYEFTRALGDHSWLSFLDQYFNETLRKNRLAEDQEIHARDNGAASNGRPTAGMIAGTMAAFPVSPAEALPGGGGDGKISPPLGGASCHCSVKNYSKEFLRSPRAAEDPNAKVTLKD